MESTNLAAATDAPFPVSPDHGVGRPIDTVLFPYTTGQIGGSHLSGTSLAAGLAERYGVRAIIIAPETADIHGIASSLGLESVTSSDLPRARHMPHEDLLRTPARFSFVRRLGRRAVVHCNDLGSLQAWAPAARLAGVPVVLHNRAFDRDVWPNRAVIRLATHVISISRACDARLTYISPARRSVLTNPFSTPVTLNSSAGRRRLLLELGVEDDVRLVGFVGNFWRRKRPDLFLAIAARLANDPRLRFVMFGRAGDISVDDLENDINAAGLSGKVLLAGFRLPPEENLASLDLLVMPALAEPFGRTLVEALLLGVPYVAADDAGHSEIHSRWRGGVVLAPDADADAYAASCRTVLAAPKICTLAEAERRSIAETLSPLVHAADVMTVYGGLFR